MNPSLRHTTTFRLGSTDSRAAGHGMASTPEVTRNTNRKDYSFYTCDSAV